MRARNWWALPSVAVLCCACTHASSEDDPVTDCSSEADFTPCTVEGGAQGAAGVCLAGSCQQLQPCGSGGCTDPGPRFRIGETNMRTCVGSSAGGGDGTIACPGTPGAPSCATTAYCGQDAQYGWDARNAADRRYTADRPGDDEPVVVDTITKLVWQVCSAGQSGKNCAGTATKMNWNEATSYCDTLSWGGHDDWVVPDAWELQSMADYSTTSPAVDTSVFINTPSNFKNDSSAWWSECYWSSTSYTRDNTAAWVMVSNNGDISQGSGTPYHLNDKAAKGWDGCYVRCVRRTGALTHERFVKLSGNGAGEEIVADTVTRLMWQACSAGQSGTDCSGEARMIDWKASLAHCEGLSWGGHDDWRLPSVKELRSIVDLGSASPAIDTTLFPNTPYYKGSSSDDNAGHYWTGTGRWYNDFALYVDFSSGFSHFYKQTEGRHVRCVRDPS